MSTRPNVVIGPCAEWLVPRERTSDCVDDHPILEELRHVLYHVKSEGELPVVTRDGAEYVLFAFWPGEQRDGHPDRDLWHSNSGSLGWHVAAVDLSKIDRRAEVRWFASAYKVELKRLTAHFGSRPQLSWSLHAWMA
jgi:hypothetical protein